MGGRDWLGAAITTIKPMNLQIVHYFRWSDQGMHPMRFREIRKDSPYAVAWPRRLKHAYKSLRCV